ncbi:GPR1 family protein [Moesziomyces antarcticus]|uniref:GPR1 family protein n=2 Tax=Pseudozyma antarctica TaxID=84753 RepID=A0A081CD52_PSEA2|nr:GPR1 family protein [Moesziomyces antarcticus]GAK64598.1 GPR1 family protein [Moesziomyces antarcticus]SPO44893.1 related to FUN34 - transmembrane protein involved in ammonia production [Moesziomyces antarcticus]
MSSEDFRTKNLEAQPVSQGPYDGSGIELGRATTIGGHVADNSQYGFPIQHRKLAAPLPLGLFAFATTTFALSMYNINARGVDVPNAIVSLALVYGGATQWICGVFEFVCGNTFGAVAFMTFGSFWLSYCVLLIPWFGVISAFMVDGKLSPEFNQAVAIYLWAWFIVVFIIILASFKSSVAIVVTLVLVEIVILLLAIGNMNGNESIIKAGGAMGLATSAAAFYTGAAALLTPDLSYFQLPVGNMARA